MTGRIVSIPFKGDRQYITGADLFNEIVSVYSEDEILSLSLSYHDFIKKGVVEIVQSSSENFLLNKKYAVTCKLQIKGGLQKQIAVVPVKEKCNSEERIQYDENDVLKSCVLEDDTIAHKGLTEYSFIELVVAMNKALLKKMFPDVEGKWVFTRIEFFEYAASTDEVILRFKHNFNFRLLKSEIWSSETHVADIYYTLLKS